MLVTQNNTHILKEVNDSYYLMILEVKDLSLNLPSIGTLCYFELNVFSLLYRHAKLIINCPTTPAAYVAIQMNQGFSQRKSNNQCYQLYSNLKKIIDFLARERLVSQFSQTKNLNCVVVQPIFFLRDKEYDNQ